MNIFLLSIKDSNGFYSSKRLIGVIGSFVCIIMHILIVSSLVFFGKLNKACDINEGLIMIYSSLIGLSKVLDIGIKKKD